VTIISIVIKFGIEEQATFYGGVLNEWDGYGSPVSFAVLTMLAFLRILVRY